MDVDASERRSGGGGRGSHALRHRRRSRAGPAATGRSRLMEKRPELYVIEEPEAPAPSNVLEFRTLRSHGPATLRPVGPPWPRQVVWHDVRAPATK